MNLLCDRFVRVDGVRLHYSELSGPGEDVVLLHGFASSTYTWEEVARLLNKQGYNVWSLDLKGFGWSEKPRDSQYDTFTLMEDVLEWMNAVGIRKTILVGNSMGGGIASLLAMIYPERVSRLVLLNPVAPYDIPSPLLMRLSRFPLAPHLAKFVVTREVVYHNLKQAFFDPTLVTAPKLEAYYEPLCSPGCLYAQTMVARSLSPGSFRHFMSDKWKILAPTLVIWGEEDRVIPVEYAHRLMEEGKSRGTLVILPECGHMPQEEKPKDTARAIIDFAMDIPIVQVGDVPYCHVENVL